MSTNVEVYRAKVTELISQADITTVSAKRIRKQVEQTTGTSLAPIKKEFDELVMEIYEKMTDDIERAVLRGEMFQPQQHHLQQPMHLMTNHGNGNLMGYNTGMHHPHHQQQQQQQQQQYHSSIPLPPHQQHQQQQQHHHHHHQQQQQQSPSMFYQSSLPHSSSTSSSSSPYSHSTPQQQSQSIQHHHAYSQPLSHMPALPQTSFTHPALNLALPPTTYTPVKQESAPQRSAPSKSKKVVKQTSKKQETGSDGEESEGSFSSVEDGDRSNKKQKTSTTGSVNGDKKSNSASGKKKASVSASRKDKEEEPKKKRKQPVNEDGTPKVNNFNRPMIISDKLSDVIGEAGTIGASGRVEMSRPEVVKQLWVYIKANQLQDPADKRTIICDAKLNLLFEAEKVNCFAMNKYLSNHLSKPDDLV